MYTKTFLKKLSKEVWRHKNGQKCNKKTSEIEYCNINLRQGIIKAKHIQWDRECHIILIQDTLYNENIMVIKFYEPNNRALKYIKQKVLEIQRNIQNTQMYFKILTHHYLHINVK